MTKIATKAERDKATAFLVKSFKETINDNIKDRLQVIIDYEGEDPLEAHIFDAAQAAFDDLIYKVYRFSLGIMEGEEMPADIIRGIAEINVLMREINRQYEQEIFIERKQGDVTEPQYHLVDGTWFYKTRHDINDDGETFWKPLLLEDQKRLGFREPEGAPASPSEEPTAAPADITLAFIEPGGALGLSGSEGHGTHGKVTGDDGGSCCIIS